MLKIKFRSERLDDTWELIKYKINDGTTQSFTREIEEPVSIHQAIVSRINPRGRREWTAKKLRNDKEWQGIIYFQ